MAHRQPILLIDSPSLYFRAYFGIPESAAKTDDGQPVNAGDGAGVSDETSLKIEATRDAEFLLFDLA